MITIKKEFKNGNLILSITREIPVKVNFHDYNMETGNYDTSIDSVKEKLIYDHGYGASLTSLRSFLRTDLSILLATIIVVFTGKGAK